MRKYYLAREYLNGLSANAKKVNHVLLSLPFPLLALALNPLERISIAPIPSPPPPPEPPYGIEYLATFESYLEDEPIIIAGVTFLILLIMNLIGLPLLRRRVKKFKRAISGGGQSEDDGFDDDCSDFFD